MKHVNVKYYFKNTHVNMFNQMLGLDKHDKIKRGCGNISQTPRIQQCNSVAWHQF